ncbi:SCO family protein [bacterium]|nr:SCO family protein [bacterium]
MKFLLLAAIASLVLAGVTYLAMRQPADVAAEIQRFGPVTAFEFTERNGQTFTTDNLKGKINIVDFIFTRCPGPCPIMTGKMATMYRRYANDPRIQFISISVDPANDSLSVLRAYAEKYGVSDNRWAFLRGPIEEVHRVSEQVFKLGGELPNLHSSKFILVDSEANIRGYYSSEEGDAIITLQNHIDQLVKVLP